MPELLSSSCPERFLPYLITLLSILFNFFLVIYREKQANKRIFVGSSESAKIGFNKFLEMCNDMIEVANSMEHKIKEEGPGAAQQCFTSLIELRTKHFLCLNGKIKEEYDKLLNVIKSYLDLSNHVRMRIEGQIDITDDEHNKNREKLAELSKALISEPNRTGLIGQFREEIKSCFDFQRYFSDLFPDSQKPKHKGESNMLCRPKLIAAGIYSVLSLILHMMSWPIPGAVLLGCFVWALLCADKKENLKKIVIWYSIYPGVALILSCYLFYFFPEIEYIKAWKNEPVLYLFIGLSACRLGHSVPFAQS